MRTDDLIRALSSDTLVSQRASLRKALCWAIPLAIAATFVLFFTVTGLRPGLATPDVFKAVMLKQAMTLALALAGIVLAVRISHPGREEGRLRLLLALPMAFLIVALGWDLAANGLDRASQRMFGDNYLSCLMFIPLFALPSLVILLFMLSRGAPTDLARTGMLAGLGAAGLGASVYALHCTDDSPLFILAWYSLAAIIVAMLGRWAGPRFLRW